VKKIIMIHRIIQIVASYGVLFLYARRRRSTSCDGMFMCTELDLLCRCTIDCNLYGRDDDVIYEHIDYGSERNVMTMRISQRLLLSL